MTKKSYSTTVYIGTVNGKRLRKYIRANSQRELKQKAASLKTEINNGKDVYSKAVFGVWADKWINERKKNVVSSGTLAQYEAAIRHLNRHYRCVEFKNITLSDFQLFLNGLSEHNPTTNKPTSKKTLESIKKVAASIFRYARSNNIAGVPDFFKELSIDKNAPQEKRRALTEAEQNRIIETPHTAQLPAMIMLFAGLRRGECLALRWKDIDLEKARISVRQTLNFENNQPVIKKGGKSDNAVRTISIPPILVNYLKNIRFGLKVIPEYVCLSPSGKLYSAISWRNTWDRYLKTLNRKYAYTDEQLSRFKKNDTIPMLIERITPHYLRHTFATLLYLQNINPVTAKEMLGHADIQTTVNIYTDLKTFYKPDLSDEYKKRLENEYKITA